MKDLSPNHTVRDAIKLWDSLNTRLPEPPYHGPPYSYEREPTATFWVTYLLIGAIVLAFMLWIGSA